MNWINKKWTRWCKKGIFFPYAHDSVTGKPSVTLMFPYITFTFSMVSVILLHIYPSMFLATMTTIMFWVISTIFYLLRQLNKSKIDLNDMSVELYGETNDSKKRR